MDNNILYSTISNNKRIININGKDIELKNGVKGINISVINKKVYVDGYELKEDGKWKRTLKALWHKLF